jgi:peptidoglycan/LPS O-acetylase OafA/YrhL
MATIPYRPAIDGLRAIAVIGVILFHLDEELLPGGFAGVDVFFVISGFLLTKIIVKKFEEGTFSFGNFYRRRIARLFPVLAVVTLFILGGAWYVYSPQEFASAGAVAVASILSVANIKLMFQGNGYFEVREDAVPFLHFWSLSLEEQFYLFLPSFIFLLFSAKLRRRTKFWALAVVAGISLGLCLYLTEVNAKFAFYLLPTRAWELLAGGLLGLYQLYRVSSPPYRRWLSPMKIVGLALLLFSFVLIQGQQSFPGWRAIIPVGGTVLLLTGSGQSSDWVERLFSVSLLVWIGKLSYSLYLWHWPIFAFVDYYYFDYGAAFRVPLMLGLTVLASVGSYYLIERPARSRINRMESKRVVFATATAAVMAIAVLGYTVRYTYYLNAPRDSVAQGGVVVNENETCPAVALIGDSMGSMYGRTLATVVDRLDARGHILSVAGGRPFSGSDMFEKTLDFLEREKPDVIVFSADWANKISPETNRLSETLERLSPHTREIILLNQPPLLPEYATREYIRENGFRPIEEAPEEQLKRMRANRLLRNRAGPGVRVIDVARHFVQADSTILFTGPNGRQLYRDQKHLSGYGADVIIPELVRTIRSGRKTTFSCKEKETEAVSNKMENN